MSDYQQPEFYRFNEDSLKLVAFVVERIQRAESLLDLGAGSGVIGIEIGLRRNVKALDLLEAQSDFLPFIQANLDLFSTEAQVYHTSFSAFHPVQRYDLIVSNPPYYLPGAGQACADDRRNICRSFVKDSWAELLSCVERSLSNDGHAYLVIKNREEILCEVRSSLPQSLSMNVHEGGEIVFLDLTRLNVERDEHLF